MRTLTGLVLFFCLLGLIGAAGAPEADSSQLCRELTESGFKILDSGIAYGVPYVEIKIPAGFSITSLCRRLPSLSSNFVLCRKRIAFFNALNPSYFKTRVAEPFSIEADTLKIPLNLHQVPEIFPAYDESLAGCDNYILVDIGKNFLALYTRGALQRVFPVSAGAAGKRTRLASFRIEDKCQNHWSNIYDSWMPWALHLKGPYYIHGGVLPGKDDSAGCIRMPIDNAQELYNLVDVGTPGRVILTPKVERTYPTAFCR